MANRSQRPPQPTPLEGAEHATVGLQFAGQFLLFTLGGSWLDGRLGTEPWFLIAGVLFGFLGGIYWLFRQLDSTPKVKRADGGDPSAPDPE